MGDTHQTVDSKVMTFREEITREQLIEWAKNQGAHLLGRAYSSKDEGDREKFADWFLNIYNQIRT